MVPKLFNTPADYGRPVTRNGIQYIFTLSDMFRYKDGRVEFIEGDWTNTQINPDTLTWLDYQTVTCYNDSAENNSAIFKLLVWAGVLIQDTDPNN